MIYIYIHIHRGCIGIISEFRKIALNFACDPDSTASHGHGSNTLPKKSSSSVITPSMLDLVHVVQRP